MFFFKNTQKLILFLSLRKMFFLPVRIIPLEGETTTATNQPTKKTMRTKGKKNRDYNSI